MHAVEGRHLGSWIAQRGERASGEFPLVGGERAGRAGSRAARHAPDAASPRCGAQLGRGQHYIDQHAPGRATRPNGRWPGGRPGGWRRHAQRLGQVPGAEEEPRAAFAPASSAASRQRFGSARTRSASSSGTRRRSGGRRPGIPGRCGAGIGTPRRRAPPAARPGRAGIPRAASLTSAGLRAALSKAAIRFPCRMSAVPVSCGWSRCASNASLSSCLRMASRPAFSHSARLGSISFGAVRAHRSFRLSHWLSSSSTASAYSSSRFSGSVPPPSVCKLRHQGQQQRALGQLAEALVAWTVRLSTSARP